MIFELFLEFSAKWTKQLRKQNRIFLLLFFCSKYLWIGTPHAHRTSQNCQKKTKTCKSKTTFENILTKNSDLWLIKAVVFGPSSKANAGVGKIPFGKFNICCKNIFRCTFALCKRAGIPAANCTAMSGNFWENLDRKPEN